MKTEILSGEVEQKEIDWNEPRLVKVKSDGMVILTNGEHDTVCFSGTVLIKGSVWPEGDFSTSWQKRGFYQITEPLTIKFIP